MDSDILELIRQERLLDAARMASARGQPEHASALFERGCDWARAAEEALAARQPGRALVLALQGRGETDGTERAAKAVIAEPKIAEAVAAQLMQRGHARWAARILEATGHKEKAAQAWERAGDAVRACGLFEQLGQASRGVRVLEAALRREPQAAAALALGTLLVRLGKDEAAVRVFQRIAHDAPERRDAQAHLAAALERLGFAEAATPAATELQALGGCELPPHAPGPSDASARLFGRYEIVAEIASSANARVLDCHDPVRDERVVVKLFVVSQDQTAGRPARARFERDVRALAALFHPHMVPVRELFADVPAIVLARMDGGTLAQMLSRGSIAPARAVEIACATLEALADGHRMGILHGAVKPSNVLFDTAGSPRLADFGVAELRDASPTATANAFGSLAYVSPEEREGRPATTRSDVFSVGVLLHEMLTGERPGRATEGSPAGRPSTVHPVLDARHDALISRLTAWDPEMRPADAFAASAEILALNWPLPLTPSLGAPSAATTAPGLVHTADGNRPRNRLEAASDGTEIDTWTGRAIQRVPLSAATLARARAFSLADHPALQPVLRVDREGAAVWLQAMRNRPLSRPLAGDERSRLADALTALHAAGSAHGAVDAVHVTIDRTAGVVLCFGWHFPPAWDAEATFEGDRQALARLP